MANGSYAYTGSIQYFTAPAAGTYDIVGYGASGGGRDSPGTQGAEVGGQFQLSAGEHLEIVVGGAGGSSANSTGGGGGSFIFANGTGNGTGNGNYADPLLVAGGGGGRVGGFSSPGASAHAAAGSGGGGSGIYYGGAGGAGVNSGGGNASIYGRTTAKGGSSKPSFTGGLGYNGGSGGFGGGGGGNGGYGGGGGGGFTGGSGGYSGHRAGVSGTSYDAGAPVSAQTVDAENTGNGKVLITMVCFCTGTLISTTRGDVAVENLSVGDLLPTLHGGTRPVRWIGRQHLEGTAIAGRFLSLPVCVKANAFADGKPRRDLWVSPGHAFYLDGALVHAYSLINGRSIVQAEAVESITYWHVELDEHEIIFAEGCTTESYLDNQQDRPDTKLGLQPPRPADLASRQSTSCAPLLKDGPLLNAIQQRIALRAWLEPKTIVDPGHLMGFVDRLVDGTLNGWARDEAAPEVPVYLDVLVDGRRLARVMANRYRADLRAAGLGTGFCSFSVVIPAEVGLDRIEVRRAVDAVSLKRSDAFLAQMAESVETALAFEAPKKLRLVHAA